MILIFVAGLVPNYLANPPKFPTCHHSTDSERRQRQQKCKRVDIKLVIIILANIWKWDHWHHLVASSSRAIHMMSLVIIFKNQYSGRARDLQQCVRILNVTNCCAKSLCKVICTRCLQVRSRQRLVFSAKCPNGTCMISCMEMDKFVTLLVSICAVSSMHECFNDWLSLTVLCAFDPCAAVMTLILCTPDQLVSLAAASHLFWRLGNNRSNLCRALTRMKRTLI